jgi:hypothetical protein
MVKLQMKSSFDRLEERTVHCFKVELPEGLIGVYFMKLRLTRGGTLVSENSYWRGM